MYMKKYIFLAASALALASCSSDDFVGTEGGNVENGANKAIDFAGETGKTTRAADGNKAGADAADLLGKKFYVLGTKGILPTGSPTTTKVFDNYQVAWEQNTAGTTSDNTNDWKYAGLDFVALNKATHNKDDKQTIKYWDYSKPQYDFIAYSVGKNDLVTKETDLAKDKVLGTTIVTPNADNNNTYASYSLKATTIDDLKECYYTDITTVSKEKKEYGKPVKFTFKNLTAKVRVAFYETVPGYSVKDLQFYSDDNTKRGDLTSANSATLYTTGTEDYIAKNGEITVTYPVVGSTAQAAGTKGYNKAIVSVNADKTENANKATKLALGNVNYTTEKLATSAKEASMAGKKDDSYYTAVLPTAAEGKPLTLRMNYTLVSDDGSNETIKVYGAKAIIPASYTQWQPNFAYTYIFKISDNTNGATGTDTNTPEGLFPITFDAVVADIDNVDFNHESITTVSTPSVTTYAFDNKEHEVIKAYGNGNEYPAATTTDIYVSVTATKASETENIKVGDSMTDLNTKGQLYTIDANHTNATEAEVIDALQVPASTTTGAQVKGRNGVTLTQVGKNTVSYPETIPSADNKTIKVKQNSVAKFTATAEATTYAYVYVDKKGEESTITTAVEGKGQIAGENEYFTDYNCSTGNAVAKDDTLETGKIYYKQYKNNNNSYAVKVIKTVSKTVTPEP